MNVFPQDLATWHLLAASFPMALTVTATVAAIVWVYKGEAFWRRCILFLLSLGAVSAVVSYVTGPPIELSNFTAPAARGLAEVHAQMTMYSLIAFGVTLLLTLIFSFWLERRTTIERDPPDPRAVRFLLTPLLLVTSVLVLAATHSGMLLILQSVR